MPVCCWTVLGLGMLLVFVLVYFGKALRFCAKVFAYYMLLLFAVTVPIPLALLRPRNPDNLTYFGYVMRQGMKLFGIDWEVRVQENLKVKEAAVLVCNHQSSLDVASLMHLLPRISSVVSVQKKELMYFGAFGIYMWLSGAIFIDRGKSAQVHNQLNREMEQLVAKKTKVVIFPEGTRNRQGGMLAFKKGAFHLAIKSQVPIIPIVISSYDNFYDFRTKKFDRGGKVTITTLPSVPTEGLSMDDLGSLMEKVRSQMLEVFNDGKKVDEKAVESDSDK